LQTYTRNIGPDDLEHLRYTEQVVLTLVTAVALSPVVSNGQFCILGRVFVCVCAIIKGAIIPVGSAGGLSSVSTSTCNQSMC